MEGVAVEYSVGWCWCCWCGCWCFCFWKGHKNKHTLAVTLLSAFVLLPSTLLCTSTTLCNTTYLFLFSFSSQPKCCNGGLSSTCFPIFPWRLWILDSLNTSYLGLSFCSCLISFSFSSIPSSTPFGTQLIFQEWMKCKSPEADSPTLSLPFPNNGSISNLSKSL